MTELLTNPEYNEPGLLWLDCEALPPDRTLGRLIRTKLTAVGGYVEKESVVPVRTVVIADSSRQSELPECLVNGAETTRREWIAGLSRDVYLNLLGGGDDGELGEMIRTKLVEDETCYDAESGNIVPGYYDPANNKDPRIGEQRAYVVVSAN
jgi:hypothetical protein